MDYCKIMRDLREDADLTQQQVADMLGTSQTMYARYERGANELPIHHLLTLCEFYHVSVDYFLGLKKCEKREAPEEREKLLSQENRRLLRRFEDFLISEQKRGKRGE